MSGQVGAPSGAQAKVCVAQSTEKRSRPAGWVCCIFPQVAQLVVRVAGFPAQDKDGEEVGEASQLSLIHVLLPDFTSNPPTAGKREVGRPQCQAWGLAHSSPESM